MRGLIKVSVTGHLNFFKVKLCGLYKIGESVSTHGCEIEETFKLIGDWVANRPLSATIPWDPDTFKDGAKCYCKDFYRDKDTGDIMLVLWKSESDDDGTVYGAEEDEATGKGKVVSYTSGYKGKKVIWGRPCYYWVVPSLKTVVSIKFNNSVCDSHLFQRYIVSCIKNRVKHPGREIDKRPSGYVSISHSGKDGSKNLLYRFNMSIMSLATSSAELKNLSKKVKYIIKRETVVVNSPDERPTWLSRFDQLPFLHAKPKSKNRKLEIKAEANISVSELKDIIEEYSKEQRKPDEWNNVGFSEEENGPVIWVDKYRLTDHITFSNSQSGIFTAKNLYKKIDLERGRILGPVKRESNRIKKEKQQQQQQQQEG